MAAGVFRVIAVFVALNAVQSSPVPIPRVSINLDDAPGIVNFALYTLWSTIDNQRAAMGSRLDEPYSDPRLEIFL